MKQRELPEFPVKIVPELRRNTVAVLQFPAVSTVERTRRYRPVNIGVHIEPPETVGTGEVRVALPGRLPDLFGLDELIGLAPEQYLTKITGIPAIADDTMVSGKFSGQIGTLHGTGNRRCER